MNYPLFFGLVGLLALIYIWIGKAASKDLDTSDDYYLMGRKLTFLPLFLTLLATQLGGGTLLGAAQEAYDKGWLVLFFPLGTSLGFIVLGLGFGGRLRKLNISTVAEIFETIYQSKKMRLFASALSIAALFFILVAQGIAARLFFASMGADQPILFIIFWSVLVSYTVMGGLKAVVNTDVLQALFIVTVLALAYFSIDLSSVTFDGEMQAGAGLFEIPWSSWMFMPLLFMMIEQDMGQRCFAAKNPKLITYSAFVAALVLFISSSVAIYFGVLAKEIGIVASEKTSILIEAVKALTSPNIATLFMVAIFLAVISTADSLLSAISSNLSCDFLAGEKLTEKRRVKISKFLTLVTGLLSMGLAYFFDNVVMMLLISYELSVSVLFIPIVFAVLSEKPSKNGAYFAMGMGALGFILFRIVPIPLPKEVMTILFSFGGYFVGKQLKALSPNFKEVQG